MVSFYTPISGLKGQSQKFDTIGQNVANAATVGYKQVRTDFKSLVIDHKYHSFIPGGVTTQIDNENDIQGPIEPTQVATNLAIQNKGMFIVSDSVVDGSEQFFYTRAGRFQINKDGNLENTAGKILRGYRTDNDGNPLDKTTEVALNGSFTVENTEPINVSRLKGLSVQPTTSITACGNLNSDSIAATDSFQFFVPVFDLQGGEHSLGYTFSRVDENYQQYDYDGAGAPASTERQTILTNASSDILTQLRNIQTLENQLEITGVDGGIDAAVTALETDLANDATITAALLAAGLGLGGGYLGANNPPVGAVQIEAEGALRLERLREVAGHQAVGTWYLKIETINEDPAVAAQFDDDNVGADTTYENIRFTFNEDGSIQSIRHFDPTTAGADLGGGARASAGAGTAFATANTLPTLDIDWNEDRGGSSITVSLGSVTNHSGFTQYVQQGSQDGNLASFEQNGRGIGELLGVRVVDEGILCAEYSNGLCKKSYALPLAHFANVNGLEQENAELFRETIESGSVNLKIAGDSSPGQILGSAVELSTVDIADSFTNLIITQKDFTANAKVITVGSELTDVVTSLVR